MSYSISNWSGSVQFKPKEVLYPRDEAELREIVMRAHTSGLQIRVVGTGHSFMPLIETRDILISLDQMQGIAHFDEASGDATLLGGTKLWKMNELLFEKKRSLENLGDINRQSIAGTISTGTHGTGKRFGTIATQVKEITFIAANGSPHRCSMEENPELFKAAQVSLGALGVISKVKLRTLPAYKLQFVQKKVDLSDVLRDLNQTAEKHRHFEFYAFPYSKWVAAKYVDESTLPVSNNKLATMIDAILMENIVFKILSEISRWIPGMTKPIAQLCGAGTSGAERVNWAHEVFSTPRWVKFQEMEYNIPAASMKDALTELMEMIEKKKARVHFPIECRFVKADDIWMSPAYGRDSAYLAIHSYKGMPYEEYFRAAESIFRNHGGRPHWGKMHFQTAKDLKPLYPMWDSFQETRRRLDPNGMFLSPALKRLFEL